jgi:hypothetical protein
MGARGGPNQAIPGGTNPLLPGMVINEKKRILLCQILHALCVSMKYFFAMGW